MPGFDSKEAYDDWTSHDKREQILEELFPVTT